MTVDFFIWDGVVGGCKMNVSLKLCQESANVHWFGYRSIVMMICHQLILLDLTRGTMIEAKMEAV